MLNRQHKYELFHELLRLRVILNKIDQTKMLLVIILQISLGVLDLAGVAVIGIFGSLAASQLQSEPPIEDVQRILKFLNLGSLDFRSSILIVGFFAVVFLVGRTALSIIVTRRILFFFARRGAKISADLVSKLLSQDLLEIQKRTSQQTLYSVTSGVSLITMQVLATLVVMTSDFSLLIIMFVGLSFIDIFSALAVIVFFGLVGLTLYFLMHIKAKELGISTARMSIISNEKILEVFQTYRESIVRNRRSFYAQEIGRIRLDLANYSAEANFMPFISKYVIETAIVLGGVLLGAVLLMTQDAAHAITTLTIFMAAATRIAPAVLRIQQGVVQVVGSLGAAFPTIQLIEELKNIEVIKVTSSDSITLNEGFLPEISAEDISFTYPDAENCTISDINLQIKSGDFVAFAGQSGAGKTTLIDLLLGIIEPDVGQVKISGLSPKDAIAKWPGSISYVPQDIMMSNGSIRENVGLGYAFSHVTDESVWDALAIANLDEFVNTLPQGIDTLVGENGAKLSGGQRQRLGIARAVFTKPKLLVLDEATSSLDSETEETLSVAINKLRGKTTIIMIAHRLSTVKECDSIFYLSQGKLLGVGRFDQLRKNVPDFDNQATLMGL